MKESEQALKKLDELKRQAENLWNRAWTWYWYQFEYMLDDTRLTFVLEGRSDY